MSETLSIDSSIDFAAIVEHCEDAIISLSLDGTITSWNRGATKLFGYEAKVMVGTSITRLIPVERHAEEDEILSRISKGENVSHFETRRLTKDGRELDISLTVSPIKDQSGNVIGASKIARDITARKRLEAGHQKLIDCARLVGRPFLDAVVEALAEALEVRWVLLCDLHPEEPGRARVLAGWTDGHPQEYYEYELRGTPCANVLRDEACFYPANVSAYFPEDPLLGEMGVETYLGVPLRGAEGETFGLLAVLNDKPIDPELQPRHTLDLFAGRVAAELQRIATSSINERLGRIVEDAASETYVFDVETLKFILVNRGARENIGYSMEELRELTPLDIKPALSADEFDQLIEPLRNRSIEVQQFQTIHRRKDGSEYNVSVSLQLLEDETRPVFFAAIEDTTDRDIALSGYKQATQRLDTILNNTTMAVFLMDDRQECIYMNPAAETLTGYSFEETRGRPLHDVIHHTYPDGRPFPLAECAIDRAFPEDNQVQGEEMFIHKDGTFFPVAFTASPIRNEDGLPVGTVIEVREITAELRAREAMASFNEALKKRVEEEVAERAVVEEQLRQAQKMEAIGQLTGGIAHDFNNLLQVIGGNIQLLMRELAGNPRAEERLQNALAGVNRGGKLASHLLAFGRRQPLAPKAVNLGRLLRGMDDLLRRAVGEGVKVAIHAPEGLWNSLIDEAQVENAILNLAINARDAMDGQGSLSIEISNTQLDARYASRHPDVEAGEYVQLSITDTGCGIPSDILDQVFDPFFTTKPPGKGSGLGLSMVYGLTKQSNGHISVSSEVGQGTTFKIYFPRTHQQEEEASLAKAAESVRGGSETILVVEDDEDVRKTVTEMLCELGYNVLEAADADRGLKVVESGAPLDLLFTDVVMPGTLSSRDLAQRAKELVPGLKVLFTSGYAEDGIIHGGRLDEAVELLSKPYTHEELVHRLRTLLDAPGGREEMQFSESGTAEGSVPLSVLLVEDEPLIRMTGVEMLSEIGLTVFEAETAKEALQVLENTRIDVMITDLGLPDVSGETLVSEVQEKWPSIRIIVASGFASNEALEGKVDGGEIGWLAKPYGVDDVRRALYPCD
ncbi:PAS domain S-box protein [Nitratireductor basaltis]|uniref:histidine kinase n=1 Tax=Nitratireductor basaltis TaxID=472175 RepID=A0A084U8P4_9HYPH|nr:PAS domain S-box protein [Nitratireductor basaltis]KFB09330.1 Chemotaxis protein CheY [Nitratireductor basaltis]